jgi:hypothetical protein
MDIAHFQADGGEERCMVTCRDIFLNLDGIFTAITMKRQYFTLWIYRKA